MLGVGCCIGLLALAGFAVAGADCRSRVHQHVILFSSSDDPVSRSCRLGDGPGYARDALT